MTKGMILIMVLMTGFCENNFSQQKQMDMKDMKMPSKKETKKQVKVIYTCVMHPEIKMSKPGKCPKCGMTLVKKTIVLPVRQQQRSSTPGKMQMPKDSVSGKNDKMDMNMSLPENKSTANDTTKTTMNDMGNMNMPEVMGSMDTTKPGTDKNGMKMDMQMNEDVNMEMMSDPFSLHLPMERHGSGTGWLPDASPMYGYMHHSSKWMYMLHGNIFIRYNKQDISNKGSRGGEKFDAPNWLMFMGQRKVGEKGQFHFSTMISLDPITMGGSGYPLLFQSGEAYKGRALVDRQHPHDLFSELSISYSHAFSKNTDAFIYVGYPGEPALGPVAFMHRPSALFDPDAPLSHHWSDATHITFGVATLGVSSGNVKLDGSLFTGREPNDMRYDLDKPRFDSYSGRLSYNPSKNWALQVSRGFLKSPEELHPDEDVIRTTASAIYSHPLQNNGWVNISSVYGLNKTKGHKGENSFLLEASWNMNRLAFYSRYEYVQKSVEELSLDENTYGHDVVFPVNTFTLGVNYDLIQLAKTRMSFGSQFSFYHADEKLNSLYGKNPMAFEVYLRIHPAIMKMDMK